jgi:magnesium and cobalt exporter, CNNM family
LSLTLLVFLLIFLLVGLFCLTAVNTAFRRLQRKESKKQLNQAGKLFFYRALSRLFFHKNEYEDLYFSTMFAQNVTRFLFAILSVIFLVHIQQIMWTIDPETQTASLSLNLPWGPLLIIGFFLSLFIIGDYLGRITGNRYPERTIIAASPIVSTFLVLLFPLTVIFLKLFHLVPKRFYFDPSHEPSQEAKQELIEIIEESNLNAQLDPHDRKLIESVMAFKDRIAREVMVPRVDIFSLSHDTTVEEAAKILYNEGYSRTPVFKDTLDNIIGVLMYKDVLGKYMEFATKDDKGILQTPISSLVKNVLYSPETKKISQLLQEFRKQQVHLAIIVDEYGGTEGIVTIEDILEEIVGDIADEYDQEEALFIPLPEGGWLIDARMGIYDIEEQFGIEIPQDGDYDTIGGYVFHETGTIPPKGHLMRKPHFELEVIRSNDRRVEKLRIKSLSTPNQETEH